MANPNGPDGFFDPTRLPNNPISPEAHNLIERYMNGDQIGGDLSDRQGNRKGQISEEELSRLRDSLRSYFEGFARSGYTRESLENVMMDTRNRLFKENVANGLLGYQKYGLSADDISSQLDSYIKVQMGTDNSQVQQLSRAILAANPALGEKELKAEVKKSVVDAYQRSDSGGADDPTVTVDDLLQQARTELESRNQNRNPAPKSKPGLEETQMQQLLQNMPKLKGDEPVSFIDPENPAVPSGGASRQR